MRKKERKFIYLINKNNKDKSTFYRLIMGKQSRIIAQKSKSKQHQSVKKAKAVKTNLKRVRI